MSRNYSGSPLLLRWIYSSYYDLYFGFDEVAHLAKFISWQILRIGDIPIFASGGPDKGAFISTAHRCHKVVLHVRNIIE